MATSSTTHDAQPLLPGASLGMLGSGQLGRMFAVAAARMGYQVHVFSPEAHSPTGQVAAVETVAAYTDVKALEQFANSVDAVTLEFENIPAIAVETVGRLVPVRPSLNVLRCTQNRLREKEFLVTSGIACAPFAAVRSLEALHQALATIGTPGVLKTAASGYDGKGQVKIESTDRAIDAAADAWQQIGGQEAVYEGWVAYRQECSVVVARSATGEIQTCGPIANDHANHILDVSRYPAPDLADVADAAVAIAHRVAEQFQLIGVCCVELFVTESGELLVNEIAPRPHNSGHLTIEACVTSQFEQQVRAVCGLPLGAMEVRTPAAMVNLLGDLWQAATPDWAKVFATPQTYLHLYGKAEPKPGRKMGHITVLGTTSNEAAEAAKKLRNELAGRG